MTAVPHVHYSVRFRGGRVGALAFLLLDKLRLPVRGLVDIAPRPHDPECSATEAVTR